jgi:hypothetical protein
MQQRESAKKAAAAAVAVGRGLQDGSYDPAGKGSHRANVVTRTASWLDRANVLLSEQTSTDAESYIDEAVDIQVQMQEVQRLIHEGPIIQQTSAGLPDMIDQAEQEAIAIASAAAAAAEVEPPTSACGPPRTPRRWLGSCGASGLPPRRAPTASDWLDVVALVSKHSPSRLLRQPSPRNSRMVSFRPSFL